MAAQLRFVDGTDPWHEVTADDALVAAPSVEPQQLLTTAQWQNVRSSWPADVPVGLVAGNDEDVEAWAGDADRFAVIALRFPKWTDGRAYSQASLLRRRFGYGRELRATGEVLVDMLPLLARCGFDAVCLRADQSRVVGERALAFFDDAYQGDVLEHRPLFAR